jgi:hypothetical protein
MNRLPLLRAPWRAEHMRLLIDNGDYQRVSWWNDFEDAYLTYPAHNFDSLSVRLFGYTNTFTGAVWELFLWKTFKDVGATVKVEETLPGGEMKCDFSVTFPDGVKVLIEATTRSMDMKLVNARRIERELFRALQSSVYCFEHLITASVANHAPNRPDFQRICNEVNDWIWHYEARGGTGEPSLRIVDSSGWTLDFNAHKKTGGITGFSALAYSVLQVDDADLLRSAVETKMRKFQTDTGHPVVIAISLNSEWWKSDEFDRFSALYARPAIRIDRETGETASDFTDYWQLLSDHAYSSNVSAILFGDGEFPGFSGSRNLDMWLNDTARFQIEPTSFPGVSTFHRVYEDGIGSLDLMSKDGWIKKPFPG